MSLKTIAHICLNAKDIKKSMSFYHTLGLKTKFLFQNKAGELKGCYLEVAPGNYVEIFPKADIPADPGALIHFCLEVDNIDELRKKLTASGISVTEKKMGCDHSYQCWVKDPDGNSIEFHEYTPQSCQHTGANCLIDW